MSGLHGYDPTINYQQIPMRGLPPQAASNIALVTIAEQLDGLLQALSLSQDRIEQVLTRAFGDRPKPERAANKPTAVANGEVEVVGEKLEALRAIAAEIDHQIGRLDTLA